MLGEVLYEEKPRATEVIEYGAKFEDMMSGKKVQSGTRFDLYFLNEIRGKLTGKIKGMAAIVVGPAGAAADILGMLRTDDGENVRVTAHLYMSFPEPDTIYAKGASYFYTESEKYSWVNSTVGVVSGGGNPLTGDAAVKVYAWE
jgi:hypothetical protein